MKSASVSPVRVLLFAALLGGVGGTVLAFRKQGQLEVQLQAAIAEEERFDARAVDAPQEPSRLPQAVNLAALDGLPQYPGSYVHPLSQQLSGQGVEMNVAWFETKDSVDEVLIFYRQKFKEAGKWGVWHLYSDNAGYAGWLEHDSGRMHLISALRQGNKTVVLPSLSYPGKMLEAAPALPPSIPKVAGAEGAYAFDFGDGTRLAKVWLSMVKQKTLREVVDGYRRALEEQGWAIDEKLNVVPEQASLQAKREGSGLQIEFKRDTDATVAVYVTMMPGV
ncbi:MAG: hypothetical protein IPJ65_24020 [Archangiaceae bacterium]|nr:hypothetical protein [Archangiaceae bacterium]